MDTLHEQLFRVADRHTERVAVASASEALSFGQLASRVQQLAGALESLGLKHGDRLSLLAQNRADYLTYHFATSQLGVILHVMNTRHVVREWAWAIQDAQSTGLIVDEPHAAAAEALRSLCPSLRFVVGMGAVTGADFETDALVAAGRRVLRTARSAPDDAVLLIYTSGTTICARSPARSRACSQSCRLLAGRLIECLGSEDAREGLSVFGRSANPGGRDVDILT